MSLQLTNRGSEWRQWDLHIHTPASFHWNGNKFDSDPNSSLNKDLVDQMIHALNDAEPAVFALMDYWTFDGWFALKQRLSQPGAPQLKKVVFPGIELRLKAPTTCRLNAHVLFSDKISDQVLIDFKSTLRVELINRPLSNDSLITLAQSVAEDILKIKGFTKKEVDSDPAKALLAGSKIAEINCESYMKAIADVPNEQAIGFMPYDTSDGLTEVKWQEHYAYFLTLFKSSPIFESRNLELRSAFINEKTISNTKWIDNFQKGLNYIPRLVVSGSDAHCFKGVKGDNDKRGYGDFPSGKATWIKADTTFHGLLQAIREPASRSFIGENPPKLIEVKEHKRYFINTIEIEKISSSSVSANWLDGCNLPLNPDLVAIIGNKGSGKSALVDAIALLGNSRQKAHFSFLKKDRFRGKSGEPAKSFIGKLTWLDESQVIRNLNDDTPSDKAEMVRYIPQGHFESLCNDHILGISNSFELELREVIFSHIDDSVRLDALSFNQILDQQEKILRDQLSEYRKDLNKINEEISLKEDQLQPDIKNQIIEHITIKNREISEHEKNKPIEISRPKDDLDNDQKEMAATLDDISSKISSIDFNLAKLQNEIVLISKKKKSISNLKERVQLLEKSFKQFQEETSGDFSNLEMKPSDLVEIHIHLDSIKKLDDDLSSEDEDINSKIIINKTEKSNLLALQNGLERELKAPYLIYQKNLKDIQDWNLKLNQLIGTNGEPETLKGLQLRLSQLATLPNEIKNLKAKRLKIAEDIFNFLDSQRKLRESLFKPVQDLIKNNDLIRDDYKLQFQATLYASPNKLANELFELIKQSMGELRGEDESFSLIRKLAENIDFNNCKETLDFLASLESKIYSVAANGNESAVGISNILRKGKIASDVYNLLFNLSFLEPRYSLLFQETQIEQLSPGQRGALLLIFYLLVDKGRNPIILDQPEENLDNETVVNLLVPVLTEAKKRRQIIMVTHNPNLAVVCDAEQIIYSSFDRKNSFKITYQAGSIENPVINNHIVNVLEGTKYAFNNRKQKYH